MEIIHLELSVLKGAISIFSEFAYSGQMQILLAITTFISTFFSLYFVAELILTHCEIGANRMQKCLFAFVTGTLLHNIWVYSIYLIGGRVSFSPLIFAFVINPNPVMAVLYYYAAMKIFGLSPIRSIKMMGYVYLYWTLNTTLYGLVIATIFVQTGPRYNYMMDVAATIVIFLFYIPATKFIIYYIRRNHNKLEFVDNGFVSRRQEIAFFLLRTLCVYMFCVITPITITNAAASNIVINLFLLMFILLNLYIDLHNYDKQLVGSQKVHISALFKAIEEFRGIKHDFYNILHTYSGYLDLNEFGKLKTYHATLVEATSHAGTMLDMARRSQENPALVSLLMDKLSLTERLGVKLMISLKCDLEDFYMNTIDFSRILACLLDNAIEAAVESTDKHIYFTCETKDVDSKLIIITNATAAPVNVDYIMGYGVTSKADHSGIGLNTVRSTLSKYGNCSFRIQHFDQEFSVYVELRKK